MASYGDTTSNERKIFDRIIDEIVRLNPDLSWLNFQARSHLSYLRQCATYSDNKYAKRLSFLRDDLQATFPSHFRAFLSIRPTIPSIVYCLSFTIKSLDDSRTFLLTVLPEWSRSPPISGDCVEVDKSDISALCAVSMSADNQQNHRGKGVLIISMSELWMRYNIKCYGYANSLLIYTMGDSPLFQDFKGEYQNIRTWEIIKAKITRKVNENIFVSHLAGSGRIHSETRGRGKILSVHFNHLFVSMPSVPACIIRSHRMIGWAMTFNDKCINPNCRGGLFCDDRHFGMSYNWSLPYLNYNPNLETSSACVILARANTPRSVVDWGVNTHSVYTADEDELDSGSDQAALSSTS